CLSSGYHRQPELGAQALRAGWFHSGDLGYVAAGQLYVTGRQKELIIVGGVNIYPQDLEAIANGVPGVHPGRTVAFGVFDEEAGTETVVLVCELDATGAGEPLAIEREVRRRIAQRTEVSATDVRLVDHRWLIKTSSGKIARAANREKYLREFRQDRVGSRPPPDPDR
ncbi:MAG TPA: hypothetical protein VLD61_06975, partial [Methylomirabilota bacterium]|nr:hypothetical protein [Methylomirabilota bacterium]